jgi:ribosomal protein L40E
MGLSVTIRWNKRSVRIGRRSNEVDPEPGPAATAARRRRKLVPCPDCGARIEPTATQCPDCALLLDPVA